MKGTLFSADFVWDENENPKLLEINTDTAFLDDVLDYVDFNDFISILQSNNITEIHVIYKKAYHLNFVTKLKEVISSDATFITNVYDYVETTDTIYPTSVEDSDNKFILRLAYDASAILDDTYARVDFNLYKLFYDNNNTGSIVELYHSSSFGNINTITPSLNEQNKPDFVIKPVTPQKQSLQFVKLQSTGSESEQIDEFLNDDNFILDNVVSKYYPSSGSTANSVRSFQIIYGDSLDLCYLCDYQIDAFLSYPDEINPTVSDSYYTLKLKHYYEFATNDYGDENGLLPDTILLKESGDGEQIQNLNVGDSVDSFLIGGYSLDEVESEDWSQSGSVLPSGSFNTSSLVYDTTSVQSITPVLHEFVIESSSAFYTSGGTRLLSYKESEDEIRFRLCLNLDVGDVCYDRLGNPKTIEEHNILFLDVTSSVELTHLNVEETDNYIISGSEVVVHNAPCFIAGTQVKTSETSTTSIENIKEGDSVLSFNFNLNKNEIQKVLEVTSREIDSVVEYTLNNGTKLTATFDHPIYEINKGWCSYDSNLSNTMYKLEQEVQKIEIGDVVKLSNGESKIVDIKEDNTNHKVYNLSHVENNNNFFAEDVLVHNRRPIVFIVCFEYNSPVEMWNGTTKPIGEIKIGDEVKSYNNGEYVKGKVTDFLVHPINREIEITKFKNLTADRLHPFFDGTEWKPISKLENAELTTSYIDNMYNLEIDGGDELSDQNYIIEGVIVSGLGDSANRI